MPRKWTGGQRLPFAKPRELSDSGQVFYIVGTGPRRKARARYAEQIVFIIALDDPRSDEKRKLTLTVYEDREELEKFFNEDPDNPIGPCTMTAVEADTPSGIYWVIDTELEQKTQEQEPSKRKRK